MKSSPLQTFHQRIHESRTKTEWKSKENHEHDLFAHRSPPSSVILLQNKINQMNERKEEKKGKTFVDDES